MSNIDEDEIASDEGSDQLVSENVDEENWISSSNNLDSEHICDLYNLCAFSNEPIQLNNNEPFEDELAQLATSITQSLIDK